MLLVALVYSLGRCTSLVPPTKAARRLSMAAELPNRDESKSSLLREIKAQEGSSRKGVWKTVQYPSAESLVKRYASQLELAQVSGVGDGMRAIDFGAGAWDEICGDWKLIYSNNLASSPMTSITLPPPPFSKSSDDIKVFSLDSVIQRISSDSFDVGVDTYRHLQIDHILHFDLALPSLPTSQGDGLIREHALLGEIVLEHDVKVVSENSPAKLAVDLRDIKLRLEDDKGVMRDADATESNDPIAEGFKTLLRSIAGLTGGSSSSSSGGDWSKHGNAAYLTMLTIPLTRMLGPSYLRRGYFEVSYVDDDLRISRGQFGELRVFRRVDSGEGTRPVVDSGSESGSDEVKGSDDVLSTPAVEVEGDGHFEDDAPSDVESGK